MPGLGGVRGSPFPGPLPAPPPAFQSLNWPGKAGSDTAALAQPPPPPPPRAPTSPGSVKVGAVPNRRLGSVRGVPMSSPPGRRARLSSPGTGRSFFEAREELRRRLMGLIEGNRVMIFSKSYCPHSARVGGARAGRGRGLPGRGRGKLVAGAVGAWGKRGLPEFWGLISPATLEPECRKFSPRTRTRRPLESSAAGTQDLGAGVVVTRNEDRAPWRAAFGTLGGEATLPIC